MAFKRGIGLWGLLFAGISSIIGSGWLFGPLFAAQIAGPAAILSWILGGGLMFIITLTFAELGSTFPSAGGMIHYAQKSHGPLFSFMIGWMVWVSSLAVAPVETLSIIHYATTYFPSMMTTVENTHVLTFHGMIAAALIMLLMCFLNYYGAQFFSRTNSILTSIKLIVPILTVSILIGFHFHSINFNHPSSGFAPYGWHAILAALPLGGIVYSFIGANTILQLAEETKNPQKNLPLALLGSILFCIVLYTLLQIAFIGAVPSNSLTEGWKNLSYPGDNGPFAGIMEIIGLGWFVFLIYADALISPFGTGFVYTASTARVSYSLSHIRFLPKFISNLSPKGVPLNSIILNYLLGLLLFLPFPGWQKLVSFIISCFIVSYIIGPISLINLRQKEPHHHRPFLLPFATLSCLLAFYICNLLIFWTGWQTVSKMIIALSIGFIYFIFSMIQSKQKEWLNQSLSIWWIFPYLSLLTIISYLGTFGGGLGIISFGMDFIWIGLLSIIIFYSSFKLNPNHFK